jgi:hypothetical protein
MLLEIIFLNHCLFAKEFEKNFPKDLQNNPSGANVVQNVKIEESNHIFLEIRLVGLNSKVTFALPSKLQTSYIPTLYICFGLC